MPDAARAYHKILRHARKLVRTCQMDHEKVHYALQTERQNKSQMASELTSIIALKVSKSNWPGRYHEKT